MRSLSLILALCFLPSSLWPQARSSTVLEGQRIEELAVNGCGDQSLLQNVSGIDSTGIVQAYGMRTNPSTPLFDGAPVNEVWEGWDFGRPPGLDSIQEFQVELNNSSA